MLKELEDYSWFPALLRNFQTDFIGYASTQLGAYRPLIDHIRNSRNPFVRMIDLCSGNGAPALHVYKQSGSFTKLYLTDKYPNRAGINDANVVYNPDPADVREHPFMPGSCYTMFNTFHHFSEKEQVEIVQRLKSSGSSAMIVELLQPTVFCMIKVLLLTTVGTLILTPFVRPFSWKRLFFTYVLPVNVFTICYDGVISVIKSKTFRQHSRLLAGTGAEIFRLGNCITPLIVISITPGNESDHRSLEIQQATHHHRQRDQHRVTLYYSLPRAHRTPGASEPGLDSGNCE